MSIVGKFKTVLKQLNHNVARILMPYEDGIAIPNTKHGLHGAVLAPTSRNRQCADFTAKGR
jgi:hypothetical protein